MKSIWKLCLTVLLLAGLIWVLGAPLIAIILRAFGESDSVGSAPQSINTIPQNYWFLLRNSLSTALGTVIVTLLFGIPVGAVLAADKKLPARRAFYFLAFLPFWIPTYVVSIVVIEFFGRNGQLARLLRGLGIIEQLPSFIYSVPGVVCVLAFCFMPFVVLPVAAAFRGQRGELLEAARLEGSPLQIWFHLRISMAAPMIAMSALVIFFLALVEFPAPEQLQVSTSIVEVYIQFSAFYSVSGGILSTFPAIVLCAICLLAIMKWLPSFEGSKYAFGSAQSNNTKLLPINWFGFFLCVVILALPIIFITGMLIMSAGGPDAYSTALQTAGREIMVSFVWGGVAAILAVTLSAYIASQFYNWSENGIRRLLILITLTLAVPGVIYGIGLVVLYNQLRVPVIEGIYDSPAVLVLSWLVRAWPIALLILTPWFRSLDRSLWDAARLEGAESGVAGWRVLWWPYGWRALLVTLLLIFVLNMQELGAPLIVQPPGLTPLIVRIFSLIHFGFDRHVAALCLILLGMCLFAAVGAFSVLRLAKNFKDKH